MLIQIHHQFLDGSTEFMAQRDVTTQDDMKVFKSEIAVSHPLPEGAQWMFCNEKSPSFMKTELKHDA